VNPTRRLHELGQSLWLDNITREMLGDGTLKRYIDELSITGLTSNPTIFDKAISGGDSYDEQIGDLHGRGLEFEQIFFELALADLRDAARMFEPINAGTDGVDGWVSLEVSPLLADDAKATIAQVADLHHRADCNVFIKIPGTLAGREAIEESIFAGIPVNVTLLFSTEHYLGAAEAYVRGLERRIEAGLDPAVPSVASLFVSRWDVAVADQGARPQRLLFASTGTKDPDASDVLYVEALAAPFTVNTMPDKTLRAFAEQGEVGEPLAPDGDEADRVLAEFESAGVDVSKLAARLQREGAEAFDASWNDLLQSIRDKSRKLAAAG
jgi:transaldolase